MTQRNYHIGQITSVILIAFIILGCQNAAEDRFDASKIINVEPQNLYTFGSVYGDTLSFDTPFSGEYIDFQSYQEEGKYFWVCLKPEDFRLDFYSLDKKSAIKSIEFEFEGPNGVKGNIDGFYYHNADSIFLLSIEANHIYLMNKQAKRVD